MIEQGADAIRAKWKAAILLSTIVLLLVLPSDVSAEQTEAVVQGDFLLRSVEVNRVNLALKEIDIVTSVYAVVNRPFRMIAWIPWKEGHTFEGTVTPVPESPPWHESRLNEMPMKNLKVKTVPSMISELPGANPFPFERYETELIFGFNATGMMVSTGFKPRAWLSWDLEQGGVWNASVRVNVTDPSSVTEWDGAEDLVRSQNLTSFFSVVISLSHLPSYVYKMVVPTWGPFVFLFTLLVMQFRVVRRQLRRGDHVGMFIGASVFTLGQALMMREVTPPELTLAELATFTLAMIYLIALVVVIGRRSHAPDADGPTSLPSNHHESNPLAIAVTALSG